MRHILRPAAAVAAGLLLTTTLAGPAEAAPDDRGAAWLERQLTDGLVVNEQFGSPDYGLSADVALGLKAIGGRATAVGEVRDAVAAEVESYIAYSFDDGAGNLSEGRVAGATAKSLVLAQATGADARDFGGVDLVRRLNGLVLDNGRIADEATVNGEPDPSGDFANVIGQTFAARALTNAESRKAGKVTRFLLKQQCSQGFFRLNFADKSAGKQGCDAGDRATSAPDTDVTALAVINLRATRPKSAAVRTAISHAVDWLLRRQKNNGSFGGGTSTEGSNTNSTGLAAWALGGHGVCKQAAKAAAWVKALQVTGDVSGTPLAGERGAIAYDRAAFDEAEDGGITEASSDQWRRASSQAAPGLSFLSVKQCRG